MSCTDSQIMIISLLCRSSVFWKCVDTVPVVPFGSDILWICYSFLLLTMSELYPQTKKCNQSLHKAWESPLPGSSSTFWIPCFWYTPGRFLFFSARRPYLTKCAWLKLTPQKENCKISNSFLFLLILIWSRSLQLQWWWCVQSFC